MIAEHLRNNKLLYAGIAIFAGLTSFGGYARLWEYRQPKIEIKNAILSEVKPYHSHNELHWSYSGNRIYIVGENRIIDFPSGNWDNTVQAGDSVDLIVRKSFPLFGDELDGLYIDDHKKSSSSKVR
jgi:hypothetical protein